MTTENGTRAWPREAERRINPMTVRDIDGKRHFLLGHGTPHWRRCRREGLTAVETGNVQWAPDYGQRQVANPLHSKYRTFSEDSAEFAAMEMAIQRLADDPGDCALDGLNEDEFVRLAIDVLERRRG